MSKEYIEALIKIGELLLKNGEVDDKQGQDVSGVYWVRIKKDMGNNANVQLVPGGLSVLSEKYLAAYLQICKDRLSSIVNEEKDRQLDNESKKAAIKANKIAVWAIVISILAATGLPQWILQWLYEQVACTLGLQ